MRTTKLFLLIVLSFGVSLISGGPCKISKNIMDCRQKGLTDCPAVVKSVTVLILDENNLTDLETMNCQNWTNLKSLSVRKNKLKNSLKFESFKVLESLDLSENKLSNLSLFGDTLSTVNVSRNFLSRLEIHLPNLRQLYVANYENDFLSLEPPEDSEDKIDTAPSGLVTITRNKPLTINLSSLINSTMKGSFTLIRSNGKIAFDSNINNFTSFDSNTIKSTISHLNLYNSTLHTPNKDTATNPNNSTTTTHENSTTTTHDNSTTTNPYNSTTYNPNTGTSKSHVTTRILSTISPKHKKEIWKIVVAILLPLFGLAIIFICYWVFCRHRNNYRRLDERNPS